MTEQIFVLNEYGEGTIQSRSRFYQQQLENSAPTFLAGMIKTSQLNDESSFLQYGQEELYEFYDYELPPPKPSSWNEYPTREKPDGIYKFGSIEVNLSQNLDQWNRQTYSTLDFIGDLGGLFDGLRYVCMVMIAPFTRFGMQQLLLTTIFKHRPRNYEAELKKVTMTKELLNEHQNNNYLLKMQINDKVKNMVNESLRIKSRNFLTKCQQSRESIRHRRLMRLADKKIKHELDLVRFIRRSRIAMLGLLALLKGRRQVRLVDKLSEHVLASSSSGGDPFESVSSLSDNGKGQFWSQQAA